MKIGKIKFILTAIIFSAGILVYPCYAYKVTVSPSSVDMLINTTQTFTAKLYDDKGTEINTATFSWTATAGSIESTDGSTKGKFTAPNYAENVTITAEVTSPQEAKGTNGTATAKVCVLKVFVEPSSATVVAGTSKEFTASEHWVDKDENKVQSVTTAFKWSVSPTDIGDISKVDSKGKFTATEVGTGTITAEASDGTTGTASVTVSNLTSISISPSSAEVLLGQNKQFTAYGSDGTNTGIIENATWNVLPESLGTISNGLFRSVTLGMGTVIATKDAVSGIANVSVYCWVQSSFFFQDRTGANDTVSGLKVELLKAADNTLLSDTITTSTGSFRFPIHIFEPNIIIKIYSRIENIVDVINILATPQTTFYIKSSSYKISSSSENFSNGTFTILSIIATSNERGAFNICKVIRLGHSYLTPIASPNPNLVIVRWAPGNTTDGSHYHSSVDGLNNVIDLLGGNPTTAGAENSDEWDDAVILHEYGHAIINQYAWDNSLGGPHTWTGHYDIRLAWSEGWATFLSSATRSSPDYLDTNEDGSTFLSINVEIPNPSIPVVAGTSNADVEGAICASLWDVFDTNNENNMNGSVYNDRLGLGINGIWPTFDAMTVNTTNDDRVQGFYNRWVNTSGNITNNVHFWEIFAADGIDFNTGPNAPNLSTPAPNTVFPIERNPQTGVKSVNFGSTSFTWTIPTDHFGIGSYQVQISTDTAFTNIIIDQTISTNSFVPDSQNPGLLKGGLFRWRVRAIDLTGKQGAWSAASYFKTRPVRESAKSYNDTYHQGPTISVTSSSPISSGSLAKLKILSGSSNPDPDPIPPAIEDGWFNGNSSGTLEAGEDPEVILTLENVGTETITDVQSVLSPDSSPQNSMAFIPSFTSYYNDIEPDKTTTPIGFGHWTYVYPNYWWNPLGWDNELRKPKPLSLIATISASGESYELPISIPVGVDYRASYLSHNFSNTLKENITHGNSDQNIDAGEFISLRIDLKNDGFSDIYGKQKVDLRFETDSTPYIKIMGDDNYSGIYSSDGVQVGPTGTISLSTSSREYRFLITSNASEKPDKRLNLKLNISDDYGHTYATPLISLDIKGKDLTSPLITNPHIIKQTTEVSSDDILRDGDSIKVSADIMDGSNSVNSQINIYKPNNEAISFTPINKGLAGSGRYGNLFEINWTIPTGLSDASYLVKITANDNIKISENNNQGNITPEILIRNINIDTQPPVADITEVSPNYGTNAQGQSPKSGIWIY